MNQRKDRQQKLLQISPKSLTPLSFLTAFCIFLGIVIVQLFGPHGFATELYHDLSGRPPGMTKDPSSNGINHKKLLVAVSSRLENVDQRNAIRSTWKTLAEDDEEVEFRFFSAEQPCAIDPYWKLRTTSCVPWNVFVPVNMNENVAVKPYRVQPSRISPGRPVTGLKMVLKFMLQISQLGISAKLLKKFTLAQNITREQVRSKPNRDLYKNITVEWRNSITGELQAAANFSAVDFYSVPGDDGFIYSPVGDENLPRNFEGSLTLKFHGELPKDFFGDLSCNIIWNKMFGEDGLIYYTKMINPEDESVNAFESESCPLVTFIYYIPDLLELRQVISARDTQNKCQENKVSNLNPKLVEEAEDYDDVTFIPGLTDSDESKPVAAFKFLKSILHNTGHTSSSFDYILLTSDETFVAVDSLLSKLQSFEAMSWRSSFRLFEKVPHSGPETEFNYESGSEYPRLPSKSGCVLSADLARYLISNLERLLPFRTIEASLAIWIAPLAVKVFNEREDWIYGNYCQTSISEYSPNPSVLGPVTSPMEMTGLWKNYKTCGNVCECKTL